MVKHIVLYTLKEGVDKTEAVKLIASVLEPLVGKIPGLLHLEIRQAFNGMDYALYSEFESREALEVHERTIPVRVRSGGVVWFDFAALCEGPRAVADYIEIARRFHTVLLSGIPTFDRSSEDAAYRFVLLVDELYDRGVVLVASAAALPHQLYRGHRVEHEFERTVSRLIEMQSGEYLAQERSD